MNPLRVLLVGCGSMGRTWVEKIRENHPEAVIAGLADIKPGATRLYAERFGLTCPEFTSAEAGITALHPDIVINTASPDAHETISSAAMRAGARVFSEKPVAETFEECMRLYALANETGATLNLMQNRRFMGNIRAYREMLQSGVIGKTGMLCADFFLGPHFGGFRDEMASPLVLDMAIHTFDQARYITGASAVTVYCREFNPPGSWYKGDASAVAVFDMDDGSVFCYRGSWCAEGVSTSWEASWRAQGEKGTAVWDGFSSVYAEVVDEAAPPAYMRSVKRMEAAIPELERSGHAAAIDDMFASLSGRGEGMGGRALSDYRDNIHSMAMVFGAMKSSREGKKVNLSELY